MPRHVHTTFIPTLVAAAVLSGCANYVQEGGVGLRNAKSCCTDINSLPPALPALAEQDLQLRPDSPHFDFGFGLAPFVRLLLLPGSEKFVEIKVRDRFGGRASDGTYNYADVRLVFLDANRVPLPYPEPRPSTLVGLRLTTTVRAPADAAELIVTSAPASNGRRADTIQERRSSTYMVGGLFVSTPGSMGTAPTTLVPYGEVKIEIIGALLPR